MTDKRFTLKEYTIGDYAILDDGIEIAYASNKSAFTFCELLNELHERNKELRDTIETICKDFEESHGMDIRNADWFTAW